MQIEVAGTNRSLNVLGQGICLYSKDLLESIFDLMHVSHSLQQLDLKWGNWVVDPLIRFLQCPVLSLSMEFYESIKPSAA